ncbi:MAG: serine hydrolase domain-containing protein [Armatimonadota bacterium]|nr:serine hydrolase domain-containing protein [Armatimonadota bacterium]MDR7450746.1 serine hydrolase domain-containing protein [Armatimonadota bacterium]MDR7466102.1 serine hydrolase domain-containing protein [Armatimonadota bacterium]MDR7493861.1 serine hydrolase domain-containing protein [Armatimonadota bacterium]MDR7498978.1 serine hydrolase domain-containing protein [Armatimonadota bacterium]
MITLRSGTPEEAELDPGRLAAVEALLAEGVRDGVFPGAVALVARGGVVGWQHAAGWAQLTPSQRPAAPDTIYDLASLTKVTAALPVALALVDRALLDLDAPVRALLPEFTGGARDLVTFRHLLAHTSGLPAWRALYLRAAARAEVLRVICDEPLVADPGALVEYSDLGIILLGFAMERALGVRIDALVREYVTAPLGLRETMYTPPPELWGRCAAAEVGHRYEREKVGEEGREHSWREEVLCGEVHDGNTYYAMEGVAPHAGLFSTAREVAEVAFQWLRPGGLLSAAAVADATTDQRAGAAGYPRGLGWVLHHEGVFFDAFGPRSFGHTGFTGTSVAVDPDQDLVAVLLTNRVHLGGSNTKIQEFRPRFHRAVREALR